MKSLKLQFKKILGRHVFRCNICTVDILNEHIFWYNFMEMQNVYCICLFIVVFHTVYYIQPSYINIMYNTVHNYYVTFNG